MEVPVLTLLSKQLQGELQFARYHKAQWKLRGAVNDLVNDLDITRVKDGRFVGSDRYHI